MTPWEKEMMLMNAESQDERDKLKQIMESNIE
jgi:hypothetical protein